MNSNLLSYLENDDLEAFRNWVFDRLNSENGLEFCASFEKSLYKDNIDMLDVRFAMKNCEAISDEYGRGCCVIHGPTVDGDGVSVAVAIKISKDRLKLIKAWRD